MQTYAKLETCEMWVVYTELLSDPSTKSTRLWPSLIVLLVDLGWAAFLISVSLGD